MFVALQIGPPKKGRRRRKTAPAVLTEQIALPGAVSFYRMTVQPADGKLPWDEISWAAGSLRTNMLLPEGALPEEKSGARPFVPRALPLILLFNAAVGVLRTRRPEEGGTPVTVVDPAAVLADRIDRIAPFASSLLVQTKAPALYQTARQRLMETFGLSLCVSGLTAPLPEHGALVSLSANRVPRLFDGLLLTGEPRTLLCGETFAANGLVLPPGFELLRPAGIDKTQFAAALFERCGVKVLGELSFELCEHSPRQRHKR